MRTDDAFSRIRGQNEMVNGSLVDQQGVHVKLDALEHKLLKLGSGEKLQETDDSDYVHADAQNIDGNLIDKDGVHLTKDSVLDFLLAGGKNKKLANNIATNSSQKVKQSSSKSVQDFGAYQPILEELLRIPLSDDTDEDLNIILKSVKSAAMQIKVKRIIANTKNITKTASKFYYTDNNIRFVYAIDGKNYSVSASGNFDGDEAMFLKNAQNKVQPVVCKLDENGKKIDISKDFTFKVEKI